MCKSKKTAKIIALIITLSLLTLTSCQAVQAIKDKSSSNNSEAPTTELSFMYLYDGNEIIRKLLNNYQSENEDIELDVTSIIGTYENYSSKLSLMVATNAKLPDVMLVHDTWLYQMVDRDYLMPLDGGLQNSKKSEFYPNSIDTLAIDNSVYALPFCQDAPLLYYRKDLIPEPLESWDELGRYVSNIKEQYDISNGLIFPGGSRENAADFIADFLMAFNAYPDFRGGTELDTNNLNSAISQLYKLISNDIIPSKVMDMGPEDCREEFEKGDAIFMWNWSYADRLYATGSDDLTEVNGKAGVIQLPRAQGVADDGGLVSGWVLAMGKGTVEIPEAWNLIEYFVDYDNQKYIAYEGGLNPARSSLYEDKDWQEELGVSSQLVKYIAAGQALCLSQDVQGELDILSQLASKAITDGEDVSTLLKFFMDSIN